LIGQFVVLCTAIRMTKWSAGSFSYVFEYFNANHYLLLAVSAAFAVAFWAENAVPGAAAEMNLLAVFSALTAAAMWPTAIFAVRQLDINLTLTTNQGYTQSNQGVCVATADADDFQDQTGLCRAFRAQAAGYMIMVIAQTLLAIAATKWNTSAPAPYAPLASAPAPAQYPPSSAGGVVPKEYPTAVYAVPAGPPQYAVLPSGPPQYAVLPSGPNQLPQTVMVVATAQPSGGTPVYVVAGAAPAVLAPGSPLMGPHPPIPDAGARSLNASRQ
jgi:hypothetical protein